MNEQSAAALTVPTIRGAERTDLDVLAGILAADPGTSWTRDSLAAELETAWAHLDVAVSGDTILGFITFWHVADELQLLYIATHPGQQRRGVARGLLEHMERTGLALGVARITLEVAATNRGAIALYRAMRFEVVGRRPGYYNRGARDAILMTRELT